MHRKEFIKAVIGKFNKQVNDVERWKIVLQHKDIFVIKLDNDCTHVVLSKEACVFFSDEELDSLDITEFDSWLGKDWGIEILLKTIGVNSCGV